MAVGRDVDRRLSRSGRPIDDGWRADVRLDRQHGRSAVEHRSGGCREARAQQPVAAAIARSVSHRVDCCITAKANGTPANRCPVGRCPAFGDATANRFGRIPSGSPTRDAITATRPTTRSDFVRHLRRTLDISAKMTFPVYEDTFHYLWRENRLPIDVDPTDPKLEDPNERAMMIRAFQQRLGHAGRIRAAASTRLVAGASRVGSAAAGRSAARKCFCCPAIRRSDCDCRSIRLPSAVSPRRRFSRNQSIPRFRVDRCLRIHGPKRQRNRSRCDA